MHRFWVCIIKVKDDDLLVSQSVLDQTVQFISLLSFLKGVAEALSKYGAKINLAN